jgi:phosphoribosylformylglycinamidine cyclo-ligase
VVDTGRWELPAVFAELQSAGPVAASEMARTFNCGIGMAVIVAADQSDAVAAALEAAGETVIPLGRIDAGARGCTVTGRAGTWGSDEDWSVSHNG